MAENRGRPKETPQEIKEKWTQTFYEVPSKPELGCTYIWHYDNSITKNGPFKTETKYPKGWKAPKIKAEKGKAYAKQPVVMVWKTSNRSNAKTKIKVWKNENIDYILTTDKLPGVPTTAVVLEVGVGASFIEKYQSKYNL